MAPKLDFDLTVLTAQQIKDFQMCPRLYLYRYQEEMYEAISRRELMARRFENTLKKVVSFFFYKKQGGSIPSYSALLNRWERLWFPKEVTAYDLAVEQHETAYGNLASYSNDATVALLKFYEDFTNDIRDPLMINEDYTVLIKKDIRLQGAFDLVLRDKEKLTVVKWSATPRRPSASSVIMDFAALKHALDYRNKERSFRALYGMYDLASTNPGFVPVDVTKEDVNAIKFWANEIHEEKIFPPKKELASYCKNCPFAKLCNDFAITDEMLSEIT